MVTKSTFLHHQKQPAMIMKRTFDRVNPAIQLGGEGPISSIALECNRIENVKMFHTLPYDIVTDTDLEDQTLLLQKR